MKKEIIEVIPPERLRVYRNLYDLIKKSQIDLKDFPVKEYVKIIKGLGALESSGCLTQIQVWEIQEKILALVYGNIGFQSMAKRALVKKGAQRASDSLDILIFALIVDLEYMTKKPNYEMVLNFLKEKELVDERYSIDDVRKRYKKNRPEDYVLRMRLLLSCSKLEPEDMARCIFEGPENPFPDNHPFLAVLLPEVNPSILTK